MWAPQTTLAVSTRWRIETLLYELVLKQYVPSTFLKWLCVSIDKFEACAYDRRIARANFFETTS